MNLRWKNNSLVERINTLLITDGGCSKQCKNRFQKLGICLSTPMKSNLMLLIGGHFLDKAVTGLRDGKTFRGTGDNWDLRVISGQLRSDRANIDMHLFASNLIENRVSFDHLPNDKPKANIETLPLSTYYLNIKELKNYHATSKIIIGRIILDFLPYFHFLKEVVPDHIIHKYSDLMSRKSNIISLPIIDANDCVMCQNFTCVRRVDK